MNIRRPLSAGCIHMVKIVVPAAGFDARQQGVTSGLVRKAPNTKECMRGSLVNAGVRFCQGEDFDTEAGELIQCESDAAKKMLPLFGGQREPSRIGGVELYEVMRHGSTFT